MGSEQLGLDVQINMVFDRAIQAVSEYEKHLQTLKTKYDVVITRTDATSIALVRLQTIMDAVAAGNLLPTDKESKDFSRAINNIDKLIAAEKRLQKQIDIAQGSRSGFLEGRLLPGAGGPTSSFLQFFDSIKGKISNIPKTGLQSASDELKRFGELLTKGTQGLNEIAPLNLAAFPSTMHKRITEINDELAVLINLSRTVARVEIDRAQKTTNVEQLRVQDLANQAARRESDRAKTQVRFGVQLKDLDKERADALVGLSTKIDDETQASLRSRAAKADEIQGRVFEVKTLRDQKKANEERISSIQQELRAGKLSTDDMANRKSELQNLAEANASLSIAERGHVNELKNLGVSMKQPADQLSILRKRQADFNDMMEIAISRIIRYRVAFLLLFEAINFVKKGLTDFIEFQNEIAQLRKVLDPVTSDFDALGNSAIGFAKEFGVSIKDVIATMRIFAQQGRTQNEIVALTRTTLIAMTAANFTAKEATDFLVSSMEQFNISASNSETIVDKVIRVQARHAVSAKDLADGLKILGGSADELGLNMDQLIGTIAAVASVTRKTGTETATNLKIIFSHLSSTESIEALRAVGVATLKSQTELRPLDDVLNDLGQKWSSLSEAQQINIARIEGQARRYGDFLILMNNYSEKLSATKDAASASGDAQEAAGIQVATLKNQIERAKATMFEFSKTMGQLSTVPVVELFINLVNVSSGLAKILGGLTGVLTTLIASFALAKIGQTLGTVAMRAYTNAVLENIGVTLTSEGAHKRDQLIRSINLKVLKLSADQILIESKILDENTLATIRNTEAKDTNIASEVEKDIIGGASVLKKEVPAATSALGGFFGVLGDGALIATTVISALAFLSPLFRQNTDAIEANKKSIIDVIGNQRKLLDSENQNIKFLSSHIDKLKEYNEIIHKTSRFTLEHHQAAADAKGVIEEITALYPSFLGALNSENKNLDIKIALLEQRNALELEHLKIQKKKIDSQAGEAISGANAAFNSIEALKITLGSVSENIKPDKNALKRAAESTIIDFLTFAEQADRSSHKTLGDMAASHITGVVKGNVKQNAQNIISAQDEANRKLAIIQGGDIGTNLTKGISDGIDANKAVIAAKINDQISFILGGKDLQEKTARLAGVFANISATIVEPVTRGTGKLTEKQRELSNAILDLSQVLNSTFEGGINLSGRFLNSQEDIKKLFDDQGKSAVISAQAAISAQTQIFDILKNMGIEVNLVSEKYQVQTELVKQLQDQLKKNNDELVIKQNIAEVEATNVIKNAHGEAEAVKKTDERIKGLLGSREKLLKISTGKPEELDAMKKITEELQNQDLIRKNIVGRKPASTTSNQTALISEAVKNAGGDLQDVMATNAAFLESELKTLLDLSNNSFKQIDRGKLSADQIKNSFDGVKSAADAYFSTSEKLGFVNNEILQQHLALIDKDTKSQKDAARALADKDPFKQKDLNTELATIDAKGGLLKIQERINFAEKESTHNVTLSAEKYKLLGSLAKTLVDIGADDNIVRKTSLEAKKAEINIQFDLLKAQNEADKNKNPKDKAETATKQEILRAILLTNEEILAKDEETSQTLQDQITAIRDIIDARKKLLDISTSFSKATLTSSGQVLKVDLQRLDILDTMLSQEQAISENRIKSLSDNRRANLGLIELDEKQVESYKKQRTELGLIRLETRGRFLEEQVNLAKQQASNISKVISTGFAKIPSTIIEQHTEVFNLDDQIAQKLQEIKQLNIDLKNTKTSQEFRNVKDELIVANIEMGRLEKQLSRTKGLLNTFKKTIADIFVGLGDVILGGLQTKLEGALLPIFNVGGPLQQFTGAVTDFDSSIGNLSGLVKQISQFKSDLGSEGATLSQSLDDAIKTGSDYFASKAYASITQAVVDSAPIMAAAANGQAPGSNPLPPQGSLSDPITKLNDTTDGGLSNLNTTSKSSTQILREGLNVANKAESHRAKDEVDNRAHLKKSLRETALTMGQIIAVSLGTQLGGGGKGAQVGGAFGSLLGGINPALGIFGSVFGGLFGGLFDNKKDKAIIKPLVDNLADNTQATANLTNAILDLRSQLINAPSNFTLPPVFSLPGNQIGGFIPGGASVGTLGGGVTIHVAGDLTSEAADKVISEFTRLNVIDARFQNQAKLVGGNRARMI